MHLLKRDEDTCRNVQGVHVLQFRVLYICVCIAYVSSVVTWYIYIFSNQLYGWGKYRVRVICMMGTPTTTSSVQQLEQKYHELRYNV